MKPRDASFLFYDFGLFTSMAEKLARDLGREVGYFCPWESGFSDGRELLIGQGIPGLKRERYWEDALPQYDVIVCPDVQDNRLQVDLRQRGKAVWGCGTGGELELLRWKTKQRFQGLGLKMNEAYKIRGTDRLRQFFKERPRKEGWFVKVSGLRGLGETWSAKDYFSAKAPIDEFESKYPIMAEITEFVVEIGIPDAKEIGYDGWTIDGAYPEQSHWGVEKKDKAYFGKLCAYDDLPEEVKHVNDLLAPDLQQMMFRGWISTELRNGIPIDITARHASPAGEPLIENLRNLPEVIYHGARGQLVQPEFEYQYATQLILTSEFAETNTLYLRFPEALRPHVKLYYHCRQEVKDLGETDCFVQQLAVQKQVGSVVALADDPEEAIALCKERCEKVEGFDLDSYPDALDEAAEEFQKALAASA